MHIRWTVLFLGIAAMLTLVACGPTPAAQTPTPTPTPSTPPSTPPSPAPAPSAQVDQRMSAAQNAFGFDLFNQVAMSEKDKNLFVSPSSIAFALAMTYNGARGEPQQAMAETLKLNGMPIDEVNKATSAWLASLQTPTPKIEMSIANSIWGRNGVPLSPAFTKRIESSYKAQVDKPFLTLIHDSATNTVLFMGVVADPPLANLR